MMQAEKSREFAGRWELLLVLLAAAGFLLFLLPGHGQPMHTAVAQLHIGGKIVLQIPLERTREEQIDLREWGVPGTLEVQNGRIRFVEVTCPDHICEKTGYIEKDGQTAVCMPNRTAIIIIEE